MDSIEFSYAVDVSQYDEPEDSERAYYNHSRLAFVDDNAAATHLQAAFRAHVGRRWMRKWRQAATKIQKAWRLAKQQEQERADIASGRASLLARARSIGIVVEREMPLLFVAEQLATAQLPDDWVEYLDDDGVRFFYFHEASQASTYEHPLASKYKRLVVEARRRMEASDAWKMEQRRLEAVAEAAEAARQAEVTAIQEAVRRKCDEYARRKAEEEAEIRRIAATEAAAATCIQAAWRARRPRREAQIRLNERRTKDRIRAVGESRRAETAARALRLSKIIAAEESARSAARLHAARLRHGLKVQALWRGRACRRELAARRAGAIALQAAWRGRQTRLDMAEARQAATSVQAAMRGRWVRQDLAAARHSEQSQAAQIMQSGFRCWQARNERERRLTWILKLQGIWRGKVLRTQLEGLSAAAVTVQARWRGRQVRWHNTIEHRSALLVQATWRGKLVRMTQRRDAAAAVLVQALWRARSGRARGRREARAAAQVRRIYDKYDSNGWDALDKSDLQRISRDAHALGGHDCGLEMVAWRLLCTRVASEVAAAGDSDRVGLTQREFRWAVRPAGGNDAMFEYDACIAVHAWQSDEQNDLKFPAGARIAITSRRIPGSGWWTGYLIGSAERGTFPANHVKELSQQAQQDLDRYFGNELDDSSLVRPVAQKVASEDPGPTTSEGTTGAAGMTYVGLQGRKFKYGGSASMMPLTHQSRTTAGVGSSTITFSKPHTAANAQGSPSALHNKASTMQKESLLALAGTVPPITTVHDLDKLHRVLFNRELRQEAAVCIQRHWRGVALRVFILPFDAVARRLQAAFRARLTAKRLREYKAAVQIQRMARGRQGRATAEATRQMHVLESMTAALRAQQAAVQKSQRRAAKRARRHKQAATAARLHDGVVGEDTQRLLANVRWLAPLDENSKAIDKSAAAMAPSDAAIATGRTSNTRYTRGHTIGQRPFRRGKNSAEQEHSRLLDNYG